MNRSYFEQRIYDELNISEKQNKIRLQNEDGHFFETKIFSEDRKGNIQILLYTLKRQIIEYDHPKATLEKPNIYNDRIQTYQITRLHPDNVKGDRKYHIPKGAGTFPFFPPTLIEKFEKKDKIKTLVLTEGAFKAFKGAMHGLDIIGLTSITHYKDKKTKALHKDIVRIIKTCEVKNVIMLYDGDCRDVSEKAVKEEKDLYKRPYGFFASARNINDLLKDYDINFYFAHVKTNEIKDKPKGLDDLLISMKGHEKAIIKDISSLSKPGTYFHRINITHSQKALQRYLCINKVDVFYDFHSDKIGMKEFVYLGTKYHYNEHDNKLEVVMPADAQNYFRIGNDYYERFLRPNKLNDLEEVIAPRLKSTITDDYGRNFLQYIAKYKDFVNVPDHTNYQRVIHNCYNSYAPFSHNPDPGNMKTL
jgi:galactitol-specific phosphotransferase system IIB component